MRLFKRETWSKENIKLIILRRFFIKFSKFIPSKLYLRAVYRLKMGEKLHLRFPKTFNEKLQWLKLYNQKPEYTTMVDKYAVKEYVGNIIGKEHIIPTIGVWNSVEEIEWEKLPDQFVLKTTHGGGGGGVVVCKDKANLDIGRVKKVLQHSMNTDIYWTTREWPYKNVPKRIIAEQFLVDESGIELKDYKFFCFNGEVKCFKIDFDRFIEHRANYYNREAKILLFGEQCCLPDFTKEFDKPKNFEQMLEIVETLAHDIPFVRIDLYNIDGRIYFGEITFFPAAGTGKFTPEEWDYKLGEWLELPKK